MPYFEAICLVGLFYPLSMISLNVLKVKSDGRIILRIEVLKKVLMTLVFAVTIPQSVMAVVWGLVVISVCETVVNFVASQRFCSLTGWRFVRTLLPVATVSAAMYFAVRGVASILPEGAFLRLCAEVATGVAVYLLGSALLRLEAFRVVVALVRRQIVKNQGL